MSNPIESFGQRLQEERDRLGLTQEELAQRADITRVSQARYETGTRIPDAEYLALVAAVGVDVGYLLTGHHTPPRPDSPENLQFLPVPARLAPFLELLDGLDDEALGFVWTVAKRERDRAGPETTRT